MARLRGLHSMDDFIPQFININTLINSTKARKIVDEKVNNKMKMRSVHTEDRKTSFFFQKYRDNPDYPYFHDCIFHITSVDNIDSIKKWGILSYCVLKQKGIQTKTGGDNDSLLIDEQRKLNKYVHLSFVDSNPMFYSRRGDREKLVCIRVSLDVINQDGVLFCDKVATSKNAVFYNSLNATVFNLDDAYRWIDFNDSEQQKKRQLIEKYEILVPGFISPDKIISFDIIN